MEAIDNNNDKLNYIDMVISQCGEGKEPVKMKKRITKKSGWICYLKNCAKTTNLTYLDCMKDEVRKDREYFPKTEYWDKEALKGCPSG